MKFKASTIVAAALLLTGFVMSSVADVRTKQTGRVVSLLPESDVVAVLDSRRFFDDALPRVLSANQPALAHVLTKLDEIQRKIGIDLRKFDQVGIGAKVNRITRTEADVDVVVLAQGSYDAGALVSIVKVASGGKYREENIGGRTVYIFSAKDVAAKNAPKAANSSAVERVINGMAKEIAVTALDTETIAFGSPARVRQTIEGKTVVSPEVSGLLTPNAVVSFAARTPVGTSGLLPLDNDELGKNLDAIRFLAGSLDIAGGHVTARLMARTAAPAQAKGLHDTLVGMQELGKNILGGSKRADQQILARMIGNAKIARVNNDVTLDLAVPQSDVDVFVAGIK
jgi:hypothetical protein